MEHIIDRSSRKQCSGTNNVRQHHATYKSSIMSKHALPDHYSVPSQDSTKLIMQSNMSTRMLKTEIL